ncbi:GAF domain-containing protein [Curtobacterium flaccumfaciens]|nr:GAF domain-containing protein [Curtobacterium flaccumfaciens]
MTAQDPRDRPLGADLVTLLRDVMIAETSVADHVVDTAGTDAAGTDAAGTDAAGTDAPPASPVPSDTERPATLDELPEEALQRTTAMAARLFDAPIALVEVLDDDREWSQSYIAEGVDESARSISFRTGFSPVPVPVVIPDGSVHPEMQDSPLVTGPLGIRFYVSVPIVTHDGAPIGTLAVLDARRDRPPRRTWRTCTTWRRSP